MIMPAPIVTSSQAPGQRPHKVLIVDDEHDLADLAEALLNSYGIAAVVACSAAQALHILENDQDIDAMFSDIMMPGMTGLQLAKLVRDNYPLTKIVLTSGYTLPALLAKSDTFYSYLPKPYRIEEVIKLLCS
jgi:two-component system OmpR family response regulator